MATAAGLLPNVDRVMVRKPASGVTAASAQTASARFGALVRERRRALRITIDDLALATGVNRKFVMDLEAGKPTCQLGKALLVAEAVGLRIFDLLAATDRAHEPGQPLLPDLADDLPPLADDEQP